MAEELVISNPDTSNQITYSATTAGTSITLTDDAFGVAHAISKLTMAIDELTRRLS